MAEAAQFLIEHGHSHRQITGFPPHLFGRYAVAAYRLDAHRRRSETLSQWVAHNATFDGLKRFISQNQSDKRQKKALQEVTPQQSRKAALGLAGVLGMKVSK